VTRRAVPPVATIVLLLFVAACHSKPKEAAAPRDVILITIDTLRADALGFNGNTQVKTPFLDSLAARGTVFRNAHAHNVVTLPSHTNILTGLYPWQHGIRDNAGFVLDAQKPVLAARLHDAGFATGAFVSAFPLDHRFGLTRGFDVYDDHYPAALHPLDFAVQERPGSETLALAGAWWQTSAARRRFLWVHIYEPHAPYVPPSPQREEYRDNPYLGEVAAADAALGNALGPILRDAPNTLVIVTGDHGESLGEHGEETHGLFAYEATLHVPLIVVDPGRAHAVDDRYVGHIDIAPTIASRAGLPAATEWKGRSLFDAGARPNTYFESLSASLNRGWAPLIGIIGDGRKLIELPIPELYDLPRDPNEKTNRFADDRRTAFALRKALADQAPSGDAAPLRKDVSPEEQARLLSLGYLSGSGSAKKTYTAADDPKNLVTLDRDLHDAIAAYQKGDLGGAITRARSLVAQRPDMQLAQEMLAFLLGQNERPDEAIDVLRRNIAAGRGSDAMRIRLGLLLSETGRGPEAVAELRPFAGRNDPDLLNAYGIALADSGDIRGAVQQFDRILQSDARNARAYQNLGIVALRAGEAARARQYLEQALALDPHLPLALNTLGVADAQAGNMAAAMEHLSRAVELDPSLLDAQYNLGLIAADQHRNDLARRALEAYLARAPERRYARERAKATAVLAGLR
jgi:arylsulfatase A-like enzyme/Flp pilus assembly protein TadD